MENKSGLRPLGRCVLIEPYAPERKTSLIVLTDDTIGRDQMVEQRAIVVEVGAHCWSDEPVPRCKPGDRVLVAKYSGYMAMGTADNRQYRFVNDRDIFAAIEVES